jgi:hypothetical protein
MTLCPSASFHRSVHRAHYAFLSYHALYLTRFALSDAKELTVVVNKKGGALLPRLE